MKTDEDRKMCDLHKVISPEPDIILIKLTLH